MKLSELKSLLPGLNHVAFQLEGGAFVPDHFHVTEVGMVTKDFIDCGGTLRRESAINFQLWNANDYEHRLKPAKLLRIIQLSEEKLGIQDGEIEVEYQGDTIGRYGLDFNGHHFILTAKTTACLAKDACGIVPQKAESSLSELPVTTTGCQPGGGCC
ncbi:DUF6428 family protein [Niabella beijingensis]|uniref:DUF6428 family protein n=1 Tax=Niabella beijingensis TaxID=2872700 RepID=UPI001CBECEB7|nr:DUF6428 family protein [Niabella beijingensis]MBZ4192010.1 DUF6428 family protein [Niabella beijingensis]